MERSLIVNNILNWKMKRLIRTMPISFGVEVLNGSMLDEKDGKNMVVINEAAMKAFGWTQPVGKKMGKLGKQCIVKGVIKNISYNAQYIR